MSKQDFCLWCDTPVLLPDDYDADKHVAICTDPKCYVIQCLFTEFFSDKAILDREYLEELRDG